MEPQISNKKLILNAATRLFVERGFEETKISDISSEVGISDSTIYEHFKSKRDILFMIPQEKSSEINNSNIKQLRGLVGPAEVKLRKLIWNYLEFLTENRDYCYILLFALRPNRHFYEEENKERVLEFTNEYKKLIIEGQANNEFHSDLSPTLILKLVYGAIDLIVISWLIKPEAEDPLDLFEPFWDLLINAITSRNPESKPQDKRNSILAAATAIFANTGFKKARIQDIAKLAGVGDGTIYQYFRNKEDLLFTLPIEKTKSLISSEHNLTVLINDYIHFLDLNKDYSSIVLFELRYNRDFYKTEAYQLFREYARVFYNAIKKGLELKQFREAVNPYIAVQMIFGVIDQSLLTWKLFNKPKSIIEISHPICDLVMNALRDNTSP